MGVVVNRAGIGDRSLYRYCRDHQLDILAEIPYSREIAEAYSRGQVISEADETYRTVFQDLARQIQTMATLPRKEPEAVYD
jgi:MinD superfamily P-loop ATPase